MIIPIRCFTCNTILGSKWEKYKELTGGKPPEIITNNNIKEKLNTESMHNIVLHDIGLTRYCCKRHMLAHVELIDKL